MKRPSATLLKIRVAFAIFAAICVCVSTATAQGPFGPPPPEFDSVEVSPEKRLTFRIFAPKATKVQLSSSDIPGFFFSTDMKKAVNDVWEVTVDAVPPGAYRYSFNVDGLSVMDPRNPATSETNLSANSIFQVPGSDLFDTKDVPHGNVALVTYYSKSLKKFRRMHVYTPPGYEKGEGKFPVLYLLHGAMDCDASWTSVGRAGAILDSLFATGKAKPMVVVMPAGHTGPFRFGPPGDGMFERQMKEFVDDFEKDVRPYVETQYRIHADTAHRAIAGLSMGGAQTLDIAWSKPQDYGYIGVFSSGIFGIAGGFGGAPPNTEWEDRHKAALDNVEARKDLKLVWFACGKQDFLVETSNATVKMLKSHKIDVVEKATEGAHTWISWRDHLSEFAPLLFQN